MIPDGVNWRTTAVKPTDTDFGYPPVSVLIRCLTTQCITGNARTLVSGASFARNHRRVFGEGSSDLSNKAKGGLASVLIRLPHSSFTMSPSLLPKLWNGHWHWRRGGRGNSWLQPLQHGRAMTTALLVASRTPADPLPGFLSH